MQLCSVWFSCLRPASGDPRKANCCSSSLEAEASGFFLLINTTDWLKDPILWSVIFAQTLWFKYWSHLWWLALIVNLTRLRDSKEISKAHLGVYLWGCFQIGLDNEGSDLINDLIHWWIKNLNTLLEGGGDLRGKSWLGKVGL